jgi:hypothetical protein
MKWPWSRKEETSPEVAKLASKGLRWGRDVLTDQEFRAICASALSQTSDKRAKPIDYGNV